MRVYPLDETWFKGISPNAKRHLLNSMASLEAGRAPTPSFKLYGKSDVSLVDDFFAEVKRKGIAIPEWQFEYEMSRKSKFGPQGGYKPWSELKEDFELYYSRPEEVDPRDIYEAQRSTEVKYQKLNCRLMSLSDTLKFLKDDDKIQERAAGWRNFDLKKTDPIAQKDALADARSGNWLNGFGYTFSRYNKTKKRLFFPMPFSLMILEAQYYGPFLKAIQNSLRIEKHNSPFVFWADKIGFDPMFDEIVTPLCKGYDPSHFIFVQRDFEKMDTTTGFSQTKNMFIPKLARAYGIKRGSRAYSYLEELFYFGATCPIATPGGMYTGYRGKASGATTTNGDETGDNETFNAVWLQELAKLVNGKFEYKVICSHGNGDDGFALFYLLDMAHSSEFKKYIARAAELAAKKCKFRVQGDKWFISELYGLYCQRMIAWKNNKMWNGYPATLILNSIVNPEKEYSPQDWDKDYRDIDIIEKLDNGANLEYFHELVDFVDNGMKYHLLGTDEKELHRILSKYERYRALQSESFNYQNLESRGDITKSPTIKYLLEKRNWKMQS